MLLQTAALAHDILALNKRINDNRRQLSHRVLQRCPRLLSSRGPARSQPRQLLIAWSHRGRLYAIEACLRRTRRHLTDSLASSATYPTPPASTVRGDRPEITAASNATSYDNSSNDLETIRSRVLAAPSTDHRPTASSGLDLCPTVRCRRPASFVAAWRDGRTCRTVHPSVITLLPRKQVIHRPCRGCCREQDYQPNGLGPRAYRGPNRSAYLTRQSPHISPPPPTSTKKTLSTINSASNRRSRQR